MKRNSLVWSSLFLLVALATGATTPSIVELTRAAERGDTYAQYQLATRLYFGDGCAQDHAKACHWYRRAIMNFRSWYGQALGRVGSATPSLLREAAEDGDLEAQFRLASRYHFGQGVRQDFAEAAKWYRRAALALETPPWYLPRERGLAATREASPRDAASEKTAGAPSEATREGRWRFRQYPDYPWYRWYRLGGKSFAGVDLPTLTKAAEAGDIDAQYQLGLRYLHGEGAPRNLEKAARFLHRVAVRLVAGAFAETPPGPEDARARADLERRAAAGDIPARFQLGARYLSATGPERDYARAAECFKAVIEACDELPWPPFAGRGLSPAGDERPGDLARAAEQGDPVAMFEMGNRHFFGAGATRDHEKAARWYRRVAEQLQPPWRDRLAAAKYRALPLPELQARAEEGEAEARFQLAQRLFLGQGVPQDRSEAARWYRLALLDRLPFHRAGGSDPRGRRAAFGRAESREGPSFLTGVVDPRLSEDDVRQLREFDRLPPWPVGSPWERPDLSLEDLEALVRAGGWAEPFPWFKYREAHRWFRDYAALRQAAEAGDPDAQFQVGAKYYFGAGLPLNKEEAARWFRRAAQKEHPLARYFLTLVYARHEDREALAAAAANGNAEAQYQLGTLYHFGRQATRDFTEAARWYRLAAQQGHSMAQYQLGALAFAQNRFPEAVDWLQKSAAQGNPLAQYNLGILYMTGRGVERRRDEAERLLRRVAEKGGVLAQAQLAGLLMDDPAAVTAWFRKSVLDGLVNPRLDAGLVHDEGFGFAEATRQAWAWLSLVTAGRSAPWADEYRRLQSQLEARLSAADLAEAQALATRLAPLARVAD
ncbi:MAG: hypothetical protein OZSIB_1006 [Candidatus Ozemobacter sibiricus]|jgi:TPR repeat protein|uniref:Sel1 repeat family protein n=1 Tax=Candidatus Ozemobacter sibiricus TaxID=2268124 RepID=A0A367ZL83_9BACT|nr:MAG: hypothetical protein OZSIB_1006 [Candidatus Ozemobacter sibiricus]